MEYKPMIDRPETVGISSAHIARFLKCLEDMDYELHSLQILRYGRLVFAIAAEPFTLDSPHRMLSAAKAVIAAAVFFAIDEGKLSLEDKVIDYFEDKLPARLDARYQRLTVYDLLTMQSGQETDEAFGKLLMNQDTDLCREFFALPLDREPGTHFFYNNAIPHLLFYLAERATGHSIESYLEDRLCKPLGISIKAQYNGLGVYDPVTTVMSARDFLRLTQWFLQEGCWEGCQLLDPRLIREACSQQSCPEVSEQGYHHGKGYGMQLWRNAFGGSRMDGGGGQIGLILPEHQMAVTIMGNDYRSARAVALFYDEVLSKMKGHPLPESQEHDRLLAVQAERVKRAPLDAVAESKVFDGWNGQTFRFEDNDLALETLALSGDIDQMSLRFRQSGRDIHAHIGLNGYWVPSARYVLAQPDTSFQNRIYGPDPEKCFLSGGWLGERFIFVLRSPASMGEYRFAVSYENGCLWVVIPCGVSVGGKLSGGERVLRAWPCENRDGI